MCKYNNAGQFLLRFKDTVAEFGYFEGSRYSDIPYLLRGLDSEPRVNIGPSGVRALTMGIAAEESVDYM